MAQQRLARGARLNLTEATALLATVLHERIRDGKSSVAALMQYGKTILGYRHVLPGVAQLLSTCGGSRVLTAGDLMVEGTFRDGTFLVTLTDPICSPNGNLVEALYGTTFPVPKADVFPPIYTPEGPVPGETIVANAPPIVLFPDHKRISARITNTGDRAIQIGSHFPLLKSNPAMVFPRELIEGRKLDVAAGTAIRFEPGDSKTVTLVDTGGRHWDTDLKERVTQKIQVVAPKPFSLSRETYASMYGPTTGDRIRLGDTDLWAVVEKDYATYGDECTFGGGKVLRDGMGQATGWASADVLDTVITNALIIDYTGIIKADIGIKGGRIVGIGKAGNPDTMRAVTPHLVVGSCTEVIAGEGLIATAGALDSHTHFLSMDMCAEALACGTTTLIGGGTGPSAGSRATTCTPGPAHVRTMLRATDGYPVNVLFTGKGNDSAPGPLREQVEAGCGGLKVHEDWGAMPSVIDTCLRVCDEYDVQCTIHTDSLNEACFVEGTLKAIDGRAIHTYHSEGAGGGHAPDLIRVCGESNILPSSTNPTRPYALNTLDEHLDMLMTCHHLSKSIAEDVSFADSRIRAETIAAEDVLHDMGAISMMSSDSQAMGHIGEVISRTWRTAHKMKQQRGPLRPDGPEHDTMTRDNERIKRYVAKYTINPAIAHGVSHVIGSIEVGKLADIVMYLPHNFGTRPEHVIKGGQIALSNLGDSNGSVPTVQPIYLRESWGYQPDCAVENSIAFVSEASLAKAVATYGTRKKVEPVVNCRKLSKSDMKFNTALPQLKVDPETFVVTANGEVLFVPPATEAAMTQGACVF
ncbi:urease [Malassezia sp. CBS 17886]|nr:urease [Malassezia sp. CBS 17886]